MATRVCSLMEFFSDACSKIGGMKPYYSFTFSYSLLAKGCTLGDTEVMCHDPETYLIFIRCKFFR